MRKEYKVGMIGMQCKVFEDLNRLEVCIAATRQRCIDSQSTLWAQLGSLR